MPTTPKPDEGNAPHGPAPPTRLDDGLAPPTAPPQPVGASNIMLAAGQRPLPDYELVSLLGRGGFGEVWKAKGPGGFEVALKFVRLGRPAGEVERRALEVMKGVRHANLLPVFGAWELPNLLLVVAMELADGTLHECLRRALDGGRPGIPREELREYLRDAARGLDFLNSYRVPVEGGGGAMGIQHKDVKPDNLLLVGGAVKVADFGLARVLERTVAAVSSGMTPAYAAPEFFDGRATRWSDQYSLAVTYCQLRGGRLPFGGNQFQIMAGHVMYPPDLSMLPDEERPAVARALAKKPEERWPSCRAFAEALAEAARRAPSNLPASGEARHDARLSENVPTTAGTSRPAPLDCTGADGLTAAEVLRAQEAWAKYLGRQVEETVEVGDGVRLTFVLVPPGKFCMGSPADEKGRSGDETLHRVMLTEPFDLGETQVTQAQYQALVGNNPSHFQGADKPVEQVTWEEARVYGAKLTKQRSDNHQYRLPTEAEWEYTCRGGHPPSQPFGVGDGRALDPREANIAGNFTRDVGSYPANALGLFDMHGNVWEWCADWYGPYPAGDVTNPTGPASGSTRVIRGGSWQSSDWLMRAAIRIGHKPGYRGDTLGFRLARTLPPAGK